MGNPPQAQDRYGLRQHLNAVKERVQRGQHQAEIPDVIRYADLSASWVEVRERLLFSVDDESYSPQQVEIIDLPKDVLAVRPLARMHVLDQLLYEACVAALQPDLDRQIPSSVYSYRWRYRKADLLVPVAAWLRMQRRGRKYHRKHPGLLVAKTDVSSFYEHVDVNILSDELTSLLGERPVLNLLRTFLCNFAEQNQVWGLPQGTDASGTLANVYLLPVDRHLQDSGLEFLRYSDDILIFGGSWNALRMHLLSITQILRGRRLHLASSKTKIVQGKDVLAEFEETDKDAIKYGLDIGQPGSAEDLRKLFTTAVANRGEVNTRDLKFCLTQLGRLRDDFAVGWLLHNLDAVPHVARETARYLTKFRSRNPAIATTSMRLLDTGALAPTHMRRCT